MTPAAIALGLSVIETLIKAEPQIEAEIRKLLSNTVITPEMWEAKRKEILGKDYFALVPNSDLPKPQ